MMYGISLNKDGTTKVVAQQLEHPTPHRVRRPPRGRARTGAPEDAPSDEPRRRRAGERAGRLACAPWRSTSSIFGVLAVVAVVAFFVLAGRGRDGCATSEPRPDTGPATSGRRPRLTPPKQRHAARAPRARGVGRGVPQGRARAPRSRRCSAAAPTTQTWKRARRPADQGRRRPHSGRPTSCSGIRADYANGADPVGAARARRSSPCSAPTSRCGCRTGRPAS